MSFLFSRLGRYLFWRTAIGVAIILAAVAATDPVYLDWLLGRPLLDDARAATRSRGRRALSRHDGAERDRAGARTGAHAPVNEQIAWVCISNLR
jgi:hypothetical protein